MHPTTIFRDLGKLRAEDLIREPERLRRRYSRTRRARLGDAEAV